MSSRCDSDNNDEGSIISDDDCSMVVNPSTSKTSMSVNTSSSNIEVDVSPTSSEHAVDAKPQSSKIEVRSCGSEELKLSEISKQVANLQLDPRRTVSQPSTSASACDPFASSMEGKGKAGMETEDPSRENFKYLKDVIQTILLQEIEYQAAGSKGKKSGGKKVNLPYKMKFSRLLQYLFGTEVLEPLPRRDISTKMVRQALLAVVQQNFYSLEEADDGETIISFAPPQGPKRGSPTPAPSGATAYESDAAQVQLRAPPPSLATLSSGDDNEEANLEDDD